MNRTVGGEYLFQDPWVKKLFLLVLKQAHRKFRYKLTNFTIMSNHVHLIIQPHKDEDISCIMQWIMGVFAQRLNRRLGRRGHVWGDRFTSVIINSDRQLAVASNYIDENPVKEKLVARAVEWLFGGAHYRDSGGMLEFSD